MLTTLPVQHIEEAKGHSSPKVKHDSLSTNSASLKSAAQTAAALMVELSNPLSTVSKGGDPSPSASTKEKGAGIRLRLKKLTTDYSELAAENRTLKARLDQLQGEREKKDRIYAGVIDRLREQLRVADATQAELEGQLREHQEKVLAKEESDGEGPVEFQNDSLLAEIDELKVQLHLTKQGWEECLLAKGVVEEELTAALDQLQEEADRNVYVEAFKEEMNVHLTQLRQDLSKAHGDLDTFQSVIADRDQSIQKLNEKLDMFKKNNSILESQFATYQERYRSLANELAHRDSVLAENNRLSKVLEERDDELAKMHAKSIQESSILERVATFHGSDSFCRQFTREHWVPDANATRCFGCKAAFDLFNRRHHCRKCGHVFCTNDVGMAKLSLGDLAICTQETDHGVLTKVCHSCIRSGR